LGRTLTTLKKKLKGLKYTRKINKNEKFGANEALLISYIILLCIFLARHNEGRSSKRKFEERLKDKKNYLEETTQLYEDVKMVIKYLLTVIRDNLTK